VKTRVINPEETNVCVECTSYKPINNQKMFCNNCEKEFELTKDNWVQIKDKEFPKCPVCGNVIGIERDDSMLS
jgi:hypothetical protein